MRKEKDNILAKWTSHEKLTISLDKFYNAKYKSYVLAITEKIIIQLQD